MDGYTMEDVGDEGYYTLESLENDLRVWWGEGYEERSFGYAAGALDYSLATFESGCDYWGCHGMTYSEIEETIAAVYTIMWGGRYGVECDADGCVEWPLDEEGAFTEDGSWEHYSWDYFEELWNDFTEVYPEDSAMDAAWDALASARGDEAETKRLRL